MNIKQRKKVGRPEIPGVNYDYSECRNMAEMGQQLSRNLKLIEEHFDRRRRRVAIIDTLVTTVTVLALILIAGTACAYLILAAMEAAGK